MNDAPFPTASTTPVATLTTPGPARQGWQTTEFWVTAALLVADLLAALTEMVNPEQALLFATLSAALYKIARTVVKFGQSFEVVVEVPEPPAPVPVPPPAPAVRAKDTSLVSDGVGGEIAPEFVLLLALLGALAIALSPSFCAR